MKTIKSLSAVLALTVGFSAVSVVSALNFDWLEKMSDSSLTQVYFNFSWSTGSDLDAKISQLNKAWEEKAKWQSTVKELTELRCDLLKEIAGTQFVYDNFDKLQEITIYDAGSSINLLANVNKKGVYTTNLNDQVSFSIPKNLKGSEKDLDEIKDAIISFENLNNSIDSEEAANKKVNIYTLMINGVTKDFTGNQTQGNLVLSKLNDIKVLVNKIQSEEYKSDVALIEKAHAHTKEEIFKKLATLNNELNKFDEFISLLPTKLDAKLFIESCPIKFAGKLPVKDTTAVQSSKEKKMAKDNVPNTGAMATVSFATASILAAAAAFLAKRK